MISMIPRFVCVRPAAPMEGRPLAQATEVNCNRPGGGQESEMGRKIFIGNMSFETTSAELEALFAQFGTCESVSIVTDRATGRPHDGLV